jgi:hypothetical protein
VKGEIYLFLFRSWSWSLPNFVWMNISGYQNYRSSLLTGSRAEKIIYLGFVPSGGNWAKTCFLELPYTKPCNDYLLFLCAFFYFEHVRAIMSGNCAINFHRYHFNKILVVFVVSAEKIIYLGFVPSGGNWAKTCFL